MISLNSLLIGSFILIALETETRSRDCHEWEKFRIFEGPQIILSGVARFSCIWIINPTFSTSLSLSLSRYYGGLTPRKRERRGGEYVRPSGKSAIGEEGTQERGVETSSDWHVSPRWQVDERINNKCKRLTSISLRLSSILTSCHGNYPSRNSPPRGEDSSTPLYLAARFACLHTGLGLPRCLSASQPCRDTEKETSRHRTNCKLVRATPPHRYTSLCKPFTVDIQAALNFGSVDNQPRPATPLSPLRFAVIIQTGLLKAFPRVTQDVPVKLTR